MKKRLFFALLTLMAGSLFAGDLEDILKKHYEAMGGVDALDGVKTIKANANFSMQTPQGPMEIPVSITVKDGDKVRMDMTIQGMNMTQVYDGEKGWQINPFMGETAAQDMTEQETKGVKQMRRMFTGLYKYEEDGLKLELVGKADVEGAETFELKVTDEDGDESYLYIDSEYYLPIKSKSTMNQMGGEEVENNSFASDYKEVDGLMLAHSMTVKGGMGEITITLSNVEINSEVDDAIFAKPAAEEGDAEKEKDQ